MLPACPTMVPTSVSGGWSGSVGLGGGACPAIGAAATAGAIGRRDGENRGRSRVMDKTLSGTAQSGLPASAADPDLSGFIVPDKAESKGEMAAGAASSAPVAAHVE